MFTDKQLRALFGIITFIFLCFLGIKKSLLYSEYFDIRICFFGNSHNCFCNFMQFQYSF